LRWEGPVATDPHTPARLLLCSVVLRINRRDVGKVSAIA
jgi:hypothetical protein